VRRRRELSASSAGETPHILLPPVVAMIINFFHSVQGGGRTIDFQCDKQQNNVFFAAGKSSARTACHGSMP